MAFNQADLFNSAESIVVTAAKAHSDLTALVSAANIHEKLRADPTVYSKAELPAIAIGAFNWTANARLQKIKMVAEVTSIGADLATIDAEVKQITAVLINFLRNQAEHRNGNLFSQQTEEVEVLSSNIVQMDMSDSDGNFLTFFVQSSTEFEITIIN